MMRCRRGSIVRSLADRFGGSNLTGENASNDLDAGQVSSVSAPATTNACASSVAADSMPAPAPRAEIDLAKT